MELSSALEPGRPPKSDKTSILSDAARVLEQLKAEAQELKTANEKLQETINDLKVRALHRFLPLDNHNCGMPIPSVLWLEFILSIMLSAQD